MAATTLSRRGLLPRRSPTALTPPVVDESACTGAAFSTILDSQGTVFRLAEFTATGILMVPKAGWVESLVYDGGGGAATSTSGSAGGGGVRPGAFWLPAGVYVVTVGLGGTTGANGGLSEIVGLVRVGGGQGGNNRTASGFGGGGGEGGAGAALGGGAYAASAAEGSGVLSDITGVLLEYGMGGPNTGGTAPVRGAGGRYNTSGEAGARGGVILRWRI